MSKEVLFEKLKQRGIFWSYAKEIDYESMDEKLFLEYLLKYGDFDELVAAFKLFDKKTIKAVWQERLAGDKRFVALNLFLARVFFGMNVEASYFKKAPYARYKKLQLLTT